MRRISATHCATLLALAALPVVMPGCIAWEIKDEIHAANQRISEVDGVLIRTSHQLEGTNQKLDRTDELLEQVQASISMTNSELADVQTRLDTVLASLNRTDANLVGVTGVLNETNPRLANTNDAMERLRILQEIQTSLQNIDAALAPLHKTMASLGSTMSFFGLGGEEQPAAPVAATPAPDAPQDGAAPAPLPASPAAAEPRVANAILGTWLLVHPAPSAAPDATTPPDVLVLLADGNYLEGTNGRIGNTGTWTRADATLTLSQPNNAPAAKLDIVSISARALTLRAGGEVRVYARP